jgi:Ca2+-binding EF-hand superfamily protein
MAASIRIHGLLIFALMCGSLTLTLAQDGGEFKKKKDKGGKGGSDEDAKMSKLIEKSYKKSETERDKVIKEISKLDSDRELTADFGDWYTRLAGNAGAWRREDIPRKQIAEIYDRMSERMELRGESISRDQFLRYAREYWNTDKSPPWKDGKQIDLAKEAAKLFQHFDRDDDGYLRGDELPAALRADLRQWDANGDGAINLDEYLAYFPRRLERLHRDLLQPQGPVIEIPPIDERPMVIRAGKLPPGLPLWFVQLDADSDGQIALFEWRPSGWPLEEFGKLDSNDDGFLEATELLKLLAITSRDGSRPFAYLMDMRPTVAATKVKEK